MTQVLRGNIIQAPRLGELDIREHGYLVLEDGVVQGVYDALPQALASAPITDYGDRLIMQSFVDMHLHAPQYPMLGMGMDLPLLDWLNTYAFPQEATSGSSPLRCIKPWCCCRSSSVTGSCQCCRLLISAVIFCKFSGMCLSILSCSFMSKLGSQLSTMTMGPI